MLQIGREQKGELDDGLNGNNAVVSGRLKYKYGHGNYYQKSIRKIYYKRYHFSARSSHSVNRNRRLRVIDFEQRVPQKEPKDEKKNSYEAQNIKEGEPERRNRIMYYCKPAHY